MGVEEEYQGIATRSWVEPVEQVAHVVVVERKVKNKNISFHSRENHEYHMKKWGRCVYCEHGIPIKEE